jgi:hypothetical protein
MTNIKSITIAFSLGGVFAAVLIASCGDKTSPADAADGGSCTCPASEPPLTGRFITVTGTMPAETATSMLSTVVSATCPVGSQIISGSCTNASSFELRNVTVQQFGVTDLSTRSWVCVFKNNTDQVFDVRATAICLKPGA